MKRCLNANGIQVLALEEADEIINYFTKARSVPHTNAIQFC
jgi:hypothetical protein